MRQTVVLLHQLPDRTSHFDWLIDQPEFGVEHRLLTFRCDARPDLAQSPFDAARLPLHRAHYLDYQGPISANRGTVARVAVGEVERLEIDEHHLELAVIWRASERRYTATLRSILRPSQPPIWRFNPFSPAPH